MKVTCTGHTSQIKSLTFSPDGTILAIGVMIARCVYGMLRRVTSKRHSQETSSRSIIYRSVRIVQRWQVVQTKQFFWDIETGVVKWRLTGQQIHPIGSKTSLLSKSYSIFFIFCTFSEIKCVFKKYHRTYAILTVTFGFRGRCRKNIGIWGHRRPTAYATKVNKTSEDYNNLFYYGHRLTAYATKE